MQFDRMNNTNHNKTSKKKGRASMLSQLCQYLEIISRPISFLLEDFSMLYCWYNNIIMHLFYLTSQLALTGYMFAIYGHCTFLVPCSGVRWDIHVQFDVRFVLIPICYAGSWCYICVSCIYLHILVSNTISVWCSCRLTETRLLPLMDFSGTWIM
jgi:hypothetical protein